jgi:ferredoxin-NADP reductase
MKVAPQFIYLMFQNNELEQDGGIMTSASLLGHTGGLRVRVGATEKLGLNVKGLTLVPLDGGCLPAYVPGSYVLVRTQTKSKPYSLTGCPWNLRSYEIVVRKGESEDGVSKLLHDDIGPKAMLSISRPVAGITLAPNATNHLIIAGGMGITAFLSQLWLLDGSGESFEIHYSFRTTKEVVLLNRLQRLRTGKLFTYASRQGSRLDLDTLIATQPAGTHVYVAGPRNLVEGVISSALRFRIPPSRIHFDVSMIINPVLRGYLRYLESESGVAAS